jgi:hypothetical protein
LSLDRGLNHGFRGPDDGLGAKDDIVIEPGVLQMVSDWILNQVGK